MQDWVWWKEEKENLFAFSATEVARIWGPYTLKGKQFLVFFFEGPRGVGVAIQEKENRKSSWDLSKL